MPEPRYVYVVWCESPTCGWGPPLAVSLREGLAAQVARTRDADGGCGPHRVSLMLSRATASEIADDVGDDRDAAADAAEAGGAYVVAEALRTFLPQVPADA